MTITDTYIIGQWKVEPELNRLSKLDGSTENQEVILVPKVMTLLQCLVENDGQPVHQDELMAKVWPNRIVSDSSIYQAIAQLRKALQDTETKKDYIERVSGKGYRLIAPISHPLKDNITADNAPPLPLKNTAVTQVPRSRRALYSYISFAVLFVFITGALYMGLSKAPSSIPPSADRQLSSNDLTSISLLTLESTATTDVQLISLNDVILSQLSSIDNMKVVSINNHNVTPNTEALLKGKIHQQDKLVRVFLQLEHNQDNEVIWAKSFDGDIRNLFALQDEITDSLLLLFDRSQSNDVFAEFDIDNHSFDQYLLARHFWEKRSKTSLTKAKDIYESMQNEGRLFPLAAVGLCNTYHFLYIYSDWGIADVLAKCKPLLAAALLKQPNLGQALAAQALLLSRSSDYQQSEALFIKAIELAPNYAFSYIWYSHYLNNLGRVDEALTLSTTAYKLAPMSPLANRSLAKAYLNLHNLPEAAYYYQRSLTLEPNYTNRAVEELEFLPITVSRAKAFNTWINDNSNMLAKQPSINIQQVQVALALGETTKAHTILQTIEPQQINPSFLWYVQASYHLSIGDLATAKQLFKQRFQVSPTKLKLALPYIYALYEQEEFLQAYQHLIAVAPELQETEIVITPQNQYNLFLYLRLQKKLNQPHAKLQLALEKWFDSEQQLTRRTASVAYVEWLLFSDKKLEVQNMLQAMMDDGWLPDTNVDPFIEIKMQRLFEKSDLGKDAFYKRLDKNRQQLLTVQ